MGSPPMLSPGPNTSEIKPRAESSQLSMNGARGSRFPPEPILTERAGRTAPTARIAWRTGRFERGPFPAKLRGV
jgi:hypothetical protein